MEHRRLSVYTPENSLLPFTSLEFISRALSVLTTLADNGPMSWKTSTAWEEKMKAITWEVDDQQPRFRHQQWMKAFDNQSSWPLDVPSTSTLFSLPLGEETFEFTYWMSKEAVWQRYSTLSQIAVLDATEKQVSADLAAPSSHLQKGLIHLDLIQRRPL